MRPKPPPAISWCATPKGAERSAAGIKPAQPGNQIGQEILPKVVKVVAGKAKLPEQLAGRHVGLMKDGENAGLMAVRNRAHRPDPERCHH